jgi:hypothetical protein
LEQEVEEFEGLYHAVEEEAKQPIAGPDDEEGGCTQEWQPEGALSLSLFPCLFPCLSPCLWLSQAVEVGGVQPAAVPNGQVDGCIEEQVEERGKDHHCFQGGWLEWKMWLGDAHGANVMWSAVASRTIQSPLVTFILLCSRSDTARSVGWSFIPTLNLDMRNQIIIKGSKTGTYMMAQGAKDR